MRVIDAHAHLWDERRTGQAWLADTDLPRVQTLEDHPFHPRHGLHAEGLSADGVIVVEGDPGVGYDDAEAALVAEASSAHPGLVLGYVAPLRLADLCAADLCAVDLGAVDLGAAERARGQVAVRDNCQGLGPEYLESEAFERGLRAYAAWGQPLELCLHRSQLGALAEVLRRCDAPLTVILDHAGKPPLGVGADADAWERDLRQVAADERVAVKLSGFYAEAPAGADLAERRRLAAPFLARTADAFGAERAIFGLDCPVSVCSAEEALAWIEDVRAAVGPDAGVFAENAAAVYRLDLPLREKAQP